MTSETAKALEKARKIFNLLESEKNIGNEEAAKNMAATLQRLLAEHRLTMANLKAHAKSQEPEEMVDAYMVDWRAYGMQVKKKREAWLESLAQVIARAHGCRIMVSTGSNFLYFVGLQSSAKIAEYSLVALVRALTILVQKEYDEWYYKCHREQKPWAVKGFRESFRIGFIGRIRERLEEEMKKEEEVVSPVANIEGSDKPCTALSVLQHDLAVVNTVMAKWRATGRTSRVNSVQGRNDYNSAGNALGRARANEIPLRPDAGNISQKG